MPVQFSDVALTSLGARTSGSIPDAAKTASIEQSTPLPPSSILGPICSESMQPSACVPVGPPAHLSASSQPLQSPTRSFAALPSKASLASENSSIAANLPIAASSPAKAPPAIKAVSITGLSPKQGECLPSSRFQDGPVVLEESGEKDQAARDDMVKLPQAGSVPAQEAAGGQALAAAAAADDDMMYDAFDPYDI